MGFKRKGLYLSPSSLSPFKDCPRCGWLAFKGGVKRPRGIFPSLPGGMDLRLKDYFDAHRPEGTLPPELAGQGITGTLYEDQAQLDTWRNWRTGLELIDPAGRYTLGGALDELIIEDPGESAMHDQSLIVTPTDYKTRGSAPKELADSKRYYGLQLDIYALLLQHHGFRTSGKAHLIYYFPALVLDLKEPKTVQVNFNCTVYTLDTDPARALAFIDKALEIMSCDTPPAAAPECEYCDYIAKGRMIP